LAEILGFTGDGSIGLEVPDQEQAQGLRSIRKEHALPDTACIAFRLQTAVYKPFFIQVWGDAIDTIKFHPTPRKLRNPRRG